MRRGHLIVRTVRSVSVAHATGVAAAEPGVAGLHGRRRRRRRRLLGLRASREVLHRHIHAALTLQLLLLRLLRRVEAGGYGAALGHDEHVRGHVCVVVVVVVEADVALEAREALWAVHAKRDDGNVNLGRNGEVLARADRDGRGAPAPQAQVAREAHEADGAERAHARNEEALHARRARALEKRKNIKQKKKNETSSDDNVQI